MSLYESILKRILLSELRNIKFDKPIASLGDIYTVQLFSNGYLSMFDNDEEDPYDYYSEFIGKSENEAEELGKKKEADYLVDVGLLDKREPKPWRGEDADQLYYEQGYYSLKNSLKVNIAKKQIDLDLNYLDYRERRSAENPENRSYVIPTGTEGKFDIDSKMFKDVLKHLVKKDSRVTKDFKIVNSEKYRNKSIADVLSIPTEIDKTHGASREKLYLYHGTGTKRWDEIKKRGLVPGSGGTEYSDLVKGWSENNIYLTSSPSGAENYASRAAAWGYGDPIVLKIEVPDISKLVADEDAFGHAKLGKNQQLTYLTGRKFSAPWGDDIMGVRFWLKNKDEFEKNSEYEIVDKAVNKKILDSIKTGLKKRGIVAYRGIIRPKFITPYKQYKKKTFDTPEREGGPSAEEYERIRGEVEGAATRFDETRIRNLVKEVILSEQQTYGSARGQSHIVNMNNMKIRIDLDNMNYVPTQHSKERQFRHKNDRNVGPKISSASIRNAINMAIGDVINDYANGEIQNHERFLIVAKTGSGAPLNIVAVLDMRKGKDELRVVTVMRKNHFHSELKRYEVKG